MRQHIGLESLVQRGRSPFYNELVALLQESVTAVSEFPNPSHGDVTLTLKSLDFKARIRKLITTHMGISLSRVTIIESAQINMMCLIEFIDPEIRKVSKLTATPGSVIEQMSKIYDDKTARLNTAELTQTPPLKFSLFLYTSLWRMRNEDGTPFFTAEEIAAGILHEFGHVDHFIRAGMRIYGRTLDASEIVTYIQTYPDKQQILALIAQLKKSKHLEKEFLPMLKIVEKYYRTSNSLDDPAALEALTTLVAMVAAESAAYQLFEFDNLLGGGRDRMGSHTQEVDAERSADEFAARNGAYQALVSMVGKLHSAYEDKSNLRMRQYLWSSPATFFGLLNHFTSIFELSAEEVVSGYDPVMRRLELIVETGRHAFHDADLPEEVRADITKQIEEARAYIARYRSAPHRLMRAKIKQWCLNVGKFGRIIVAPFHNRLSQDYHRLQNETRSLSRHPLYYLAKK